MRISDKELNRWGRSLAGRGLKEAIVGLRHCNFGDPSQNELKVIEHYTRAIEYFYHLGKYRICCNRRIKEYREKTKRRDKTIQKLRSHTNTESYSDLPEDFFIVTHKERKEDET